MLQVSMLVWSAPSTVLISHFIAHFIFHFVFQVPEPYYTFVVAGCQVKAPSHHHSKE